MNDTTKNSAVIPRWLPLPDKDASAWWKKTSRPLSLMLSWAGLDLHVQYAALLFHYHFVVRYLGPPPYKHAPEWKSFMTDDFSPIEYSWSWSSLTDPPRVRYSIEAIGPSAGSQSDPFNLNATKELVSALKPAFPHSNWDLYDFLQSRFAPICRDSGTVVPRWQQRSSMFLGFSIDSTGVNMQAYLTMAEVSCHKEAWEKCYESIQALKFEGLQYPAIDMLYRFLRNSHEGRQLEYLGLGLDCVDPHESRLKIYFRSPDVTFESVKRVLTMNGDLEGVWSADHLQRLYDLYQRVMSFQSRPSRNHADHPTAGMLYNFDVQHGRKVPLSKVYLPVRHYGANDLDVAMGLVEFQRQNGKGVEAEEYINMLRDVCSHRRLEDGLGLQTYISVVPRKGSLNITAYVNQGVYSS